MKRSTWIPLVAAGAALAGVAAGVMAVLKKQKKAVPAEEPVVAVEGEEVIEMPVTEEGEAPAEPAQAPAEEAPAAEEPFAE